MAASQKSSNPSEKITEQTEPFNSFILITSPAKTSRPTDLICF